LALDFLALDFLALDFLALDFLAFNFLGAVLGEPLRRSLTRTIGALGSFLASGYPLHHLHGFASLAVSVVPLLCASRKAKAFPLAAWRKIRQKNAPCA
jgi:hypothetical protein